MEPGTVNPATETDFRSEVLKRWTEFKERWPWIDPVLKRLVALRPYIITILVALVFHQTISVVGREALSHTAGNSLPDGYSAGVIGKNSHGETRRFDISYFDTYAGAPQGCSYDRINETSTITIDYDVYCDIGGEKVRVANISTMTTSFYAGLPFIRLEEGAVSGFRHPTFFWSPF